MLKDPQLFADYENVLKEDNADTAQAAKMRELLRDVHHRMMITEEPVPDEIRAQFPQEEDLHLYQATFDFADLAANCLVNTRTRLMSDRIWPTHQNSQDDGEAIDSMFINVFVKTLSQMLSERNEIVTPVCVLFYGDGQVMTIVRTDPELAA